MIGKPGVGKSLFASKFASTFNAISIDYLEIQDVSRDDEQLAGEILNMLFEKVLPLRQTIVIDGPGNTLQERKEISKFAESKGYIPLFVWVQLDEETAEHRSVHSGENPMSKKEFAARNEEFESPGYKETYTVISGKHTFASQARTVLKKLSPISSSKPAQAPRRPVVIHQTTKTPDTAHARQAIRKQATQSVQQPSPVVLRPLPKFTRSDKPVRLKTRSK